MKPTDTFAFDNPEWYRNLLLSIRYGIGLQNYPAMADIVGKFLSRELVLSVPATERPETAAASAAQLAADGYCRLGKLLGAGEVADVVAHLDRHALRDSFNRTSERFKRSSAPASTHVGEFDVEEALAACPHLLEIANAPAVLARVHAFLGAPPTIQHFSAWWSFAGRPAAKDAQLFHYDRHCFRFAKLFMYLTDVDMESGPHVYVKGSARVADWMEHLSGIRAKDRVAAQRFLDMLNAVRKNDRDVVDFYGADRIEHCTGEAGEAFLVDTSGIHKGLLPKSRDRLVFQATYALLPDMKRPVDRIGRPGFTTAVARRYPGAVDRSYIAYVNRMAIDDPEGDDTGAPSP